MIKANYERATSFFFTKTLHNTPIIKNVVAYGSNYLVKVIVEYIQDIFT